jgi:hypothetical protein
MSRVVDDAIRMLREMPENVQEATARAIIEYNAGYDDLALSDNQVAEVERRIADPDRNLLSLADVLHRARPFGV